jgi:hypothetical protein
MLSNIQKARRAHTLHAQAKYSIISNALSEPSALAPGDGERERMPIAPMQLDSTPKML